VVPGARARGRARVCGGRSIRLSRRQRRLRRGRHRSRSAL